MSESKKEREGDNKKGCYSGCVQCRHHVALLSAAPNVRPLFSVFKMPYVPQGLCSDISYVISAGKNSV